MHNTHDHDPTVAQPTLGHAERERAVESAVELAAAGEDGARLSTAAAQKDCPATPVPPPVQAPAAGKWKPHDDVTLVEDAEPPAGLDIEDTLPRGQALLATTVRHRFLQLCSLALKLQRRDEHLAPLIIALGAAGIGKTIAAAYFERAQPIKAHTGRSGCVRVKNYPHASSARLILAYLLALGVTPEPGHGADRLDQAVHETRRLDIDLVIVDEGDYLTIESFEAFRKLRDRTGCAVIVVGLPPLVRVFVDHGRQQFGDRAGIYANLREMPPAEVVQTVLPQLAVPGWSFDPRDPAAAALGLQMWARCRPSFRTLRFWLDLASVMAEDLGPPRIDEALLDEVWDLMRGLPLAYRMAAANSTRGADDAQPSALRGTADGQPVDLTTNTAHASDADEGRAAHVRQSPKERKATGKRAQPSQRHPDDQVPGEGLSAELLGSGVGERTVAGEAVPGASPLDPQALDMMADVLDHWRQRQLERQALPEDPASGVSPVGADTLARPASITPPAGVQPQTADDRRQDARSTSPALAKGKAEEEPR